MHISKIHSLKVRILAVPFHRQKDSHCHQSKEKEFFGKTKVNMKGNPEHVYVGAKGILRNYKASISFNIPFGPDVQIVASFTKIVFGLGTGLSKP